MRRATRILIVLAFFVSAVQGTLWARDYARCLDCHLGIETLDKDHALPCRDCHLAPANRRAPLAEHSAIVRHPAAPANVKIFCGRCHKDEIATLENSLHYTLAGLVNQTRYLWGAQPDPGPRYSAGEHDTLKGLPETPAAIESPADLVDDLLMRRCFRCHLGSPPPRQRGLFRGLGCAACHLSYGVDGIYRGKDPTIRGRAGYSLKHSFARPVPSSGCNSCHNGPRVGGDYPGLFEHDYHRSYRAPIKDGLLPERKYLMDHHRLAADVHFVAGLGCVDCHQKGDVMGRGPLLGSQQRAVAVRCLDCHGTGPRHPGASAGRLFAKDGKVHDLPGYKRATAAHRIPGMGRVHCTSCHSGWSFMDYGPSLMLDQRADLSRWARWRLQSDPTVLSLFDESGRFVGPPPEKGVWLLGWRFRRWEFLTLGVDARNRVVPVRPRYQYQVSYVDRSGEVVLDSVVPTRGDRSGPGWAFMPFYPHTLQRRGRACDACHGRGLAAGNGLFSGAGPDLALTKPSLPALPGPRLLNPGEKARLLEKSKTFRRWRYRTLLWDAGKGKDRRGEKAGKR